MAAAGDEEPQKLCEAYYYAGETYRLAGDHDRAEAMFQACVNTGTAIDRGNYQDRLSEFELAGWRLSPGEHQE